MGQVLQSHHLLHWEASLLSILKDLEAQTDASALVARRYIEECLEDLETAKTLSHCDASRALGLCRAPEHFEPSCDPRDSDDVVICGHWEKIRGSEIDVELEKAKLVSLMMQIGKKHGKDSVGCDALLDSIMELAESAQQERSKT